MANKLGTVVIGGGTGFIGREIIKLLKDKGYDITIVSRKSVPSSITWNDLQNSGLPKKTVAVINLAGQNILDPTRRWTPGFKQNVWSSRVNTTKYLADAIKEAEKKPSVFATISGVGFYQPSTTVVYDEESTGGNFDFLSRLCTDWESVSHLPEEYNVRVVNIRSGVVLGRNGGMIQQLILPFYAGVGGPVGSGLQYMPWIHIKDIASMFVFAIENTEVKGVLNGVAPEQITNGTFSKAFAKALWRPSLIPLPKFAVNFMFGSERAKVITEGQKVIPKKFLEYGFNYQYPNIDSATKECAKLFYKETE